MAEHIFRTSRQKGYKVSKGILFIFSWLLIILTTYSNEYPYWERKISSKSNEIIKHLKYYRQNKFGKHESKIPNTENSEFLIDDDIVYIPAIDDEAYPAIAFDGTYYLVVWQDGHDEDVYDIYGARVNQAGVLIDSSRIAISIATRGQSQPSVAFDGTNYLVVWQDYRNRNYDIYGARVSPAGEVLDLDGFVISTALDNQSYPAVAFCETCYLIVWQDERGVGYPDIYGARVSPEGVVLDPDGIAIATGISEQEYPSVASDSANYLVVWQGWGTNPSSNEVIYGARVNQAGIVLDPNGFAISSDSDTNGQWLPSVAFDGTNYLVVWLDFRNVDNDIYGARVNQDGVVLDTNGIAICTAPEYQWPFSITFDGTNYFVVWDDGRNDDVYGARVNQSGIVLDTNGILIFVVTGDEPHPVVAFDGTNYLVVFENEPIFHYDIFGTRVNQSGVVLDTNGIAISSIKANLQKEPCAAFDGTNYLVVWEDERSDDYHIYGARVNQMGVVLDTISIPISTVSGGQFSPSVAFDGVNYLVVWSDYRNGTTPDIYGARVNQDGMILDPNGIAISTAINEQGFPSLAFDGNNYLIVWHDKRSGYEDIYGARVNQTGVVLDPNGIAICTAVSLQRYPSVAYDGTNYLVAWQDSRGTSDIYGARVSQAGMVLDTIGIAISTAIRWQWYPSVAFDGTNYFVVWEDGRNWPLPDDIYGARVSQSGAVLDTNGIAISTSVNYESHPCIVFDGMDYLVVWEDGVDLTGALINTSGVVIDSFKVSTQFGEQRSPALAHGDGNNFLITYSSWTGTVRGKTYSTYRIWGMLYPFAGIEEERSTLDATRRTLKIYPNPTNQGRIVRVSCPSAVKELKIYDITGKLVKSFSTNHQPLSTNNWYVWDGTDDLSRELPIGIYIFQAKTTKGITETQKIVILR